MDRRGRLLAVLLGTALAALLVASSAAASSAQFTRAYFNSDYSRGSFAFTETFTDCSGTCTWLPIATVQPSLPSYSCRGDEWDDSDPNTKVVWTGANQTGNSTVSADLTDVPILTGQSGQRICVSAVRQMQVRDPVCVAQAPILGMDPSTCPFVSRISGLAVGSAILTLAPTAPPPPTTGGGDACSEAKAALTKAKAKLKKLKAKKASSAALKRAKRKVQVAKGVVKASC